MTLIEIWYWNILILKIKKFVNRDLIKFLTKRDSDSRFYDQLWDVLYESKSTNVLRVKEHFYRPGSNCIIYSSFYSIHKCDALFPGWIRARECPDYLLTHVHLHNALAKNMTEAINENVRDRDSSVSAREQRQREGTRRGEGWVTFRAVQRSSALRPPFATKISRDGLFIARDRFIMTGQRIARLSEASNNLKYKIRPWIAIM